MILETYAYVNWRSIYPENTSKDQYFKSRWQPVVSINGLKFFSYFFLYTSQCFYFLLSYSLSSQSFTCLTTHHSELI